MPADFDTCVREGGKVITKRLSPTEYMHMCKDKGGKWHSGEKKMYKKILKGGKNE